MRLKVIAIVGLFTALAVATFAANLFAFPSGVNGDFACGDCHSGGASAIGLVDTMTAEPIDAGAAPVLDGVVEAIWNKATAVSIPVNYGWAGSTNVSMKALYTDDKVYFLAQWGDNSLSDRRRPWKKTADSGIGSWMRVPAKSQSGSSVTDNGWFTTNGGTQLRTSPPADAAYEDKFAVIWGARDTTATVANVANFKTKGCAILCHVSFGGGTANDKKYTNAPGEIADMWHWKLVRTGTVGFVDDQYVDNTLPTTATPSAGRKSDPGLAYLNNEATTTIGDTQTPAHTGPGQPVATDTAGFDPYFIPYADRVLNTTETLGAVAVGQEIAGILVRPLTGDRGDISAQVETTSTVGYNASTKTWTLEFSRNLVTGSGFDVQFDNLNDAYYFGVAVFDNAQIEHSFNKGVYALKFGPRVTPPPTVPPTVPPVMTADIKVMPGSISLRSSGLLRVILYGKPEFDALDIDLNSLDFAGAPLDHARNTVVDYNGDGLPDILLYFKIPKTGLKAGDTEACLTGKTNGGKSFKGCASVKVSGGFFGAMSRTPAKSNACPVR
ncbi:MAG: hypothetical protein KGZ93_07195 [Actinobacteria bacterium]|nr:hypothetical protein [Actinomycetota bacterium]